ncbi:heat shock 70 kDa protein 16 isoform X1 [Lactuca sativa]|nr:heat shock 70 kDa protein 16 isoform X1 [Lactuca sativa]
MSVVGFDIGNENCAIAVAKRGGIDVLLNDESKRETPAVVSFGEKQRFLGSAGAAFATKFPKSTISQIKRLIGKLYNEPSVKEDLKLLPFETSEGPYGGVLIHLEYLGKTWTFTPVEILGMLFAHLKQLTEKNLESPVEDCVIGIPSYFTDLQRREYINAALIAGLRPLKLMHDCTAIALGYGIYKTDFSDEKTTNVIFVDIGHSDTQVTVVAFEEGKMTILSHSFDPNLGGRDFDEVLFRHFATQFKEEHDIDVYSNARASIRLRASCEKLKKILSANAEAPLSIDCLIDDKDLNGFIRREEFEKLSAKLLQRVSDVCQEAIKDSGLGADKIDTIELVGSGSRIPSVTRKIASIFDKEPMRTLNGSECVARGCALACAMLSPTCQVKDHKVQDSFPYSTGVFFDDGKRCPEFTLFPKGSSFPRNKTVAYHGNTTSHCHVCYINKTDFPAGLSHEAGYFMIRPSQASGAEKVLVKVKVHLNIHGIVEIEAASFQFIEHKHPSSKKSFRYSWPLGIKAKRLFQNNAAYRRFSSSRLSTERYAEEARWGRARNLEVSENYCVLTTIDEIRVAQKRAQMFAEHDIKVEKTKEKRNTLESFIYETRSKLLSSYRSVTTDSEVEIISETLQKTEDWLYEEGDDESETVYIRRLEDLSKLLDPIEIRYKDEIARKEATKALRTCIQENHLAANSLPPSHKKKVNDECIEAEGWLDHLSRLQDSLAKSVTRVYFLSAISEITQALKRRCEAIFSSKLSLLKYEEPVDSDQMQNPSEMQVEN